jgi:hypothetical protein
MSSGTAGQLLLDVALESIYCSCVRLIPEPNESRSFVDGPSFGRHRIRRKIIRRAQRDTFHDDLIVVYSRARAPRRLHGAWAAGHGVPHQTMRGLLMIYR